MASLEQLSKRIEKLSPTSHYSFDDWVIAHSNRRGNETTEDALERLYPKAQPAPEQMAFVEKMVANGNIKLTGTAQENNDE